uniref:Transforming acidic coiled-coil-containing protein C-terminal domain-containing protein n=1 Tax=Eptatretus burgeri TaxID=7764 RepID=A0A8C4R4Q6_EPTBU
MILLSFCCLDAPDEVISECAVDHEITNKELPEANDISTVLEVTNVNSFEEQPIASRGCYAIDFDDLENVNPFGGDSVNNILKSSADIDACKESVSSLPTVFDNTESISFEPITNTACIFTEQKLSKDILENNVQAFKVDQSSIGEDVVPQVTYNFDPDNLDENPFGGSSKLQNSPPLPRVSYNFDPEMIDLIDPFKCGGSKLQNSPPTCRKHPVIASHEEPTSLDTVLSQPVPHSPCKLDIDFSDKENATAAPPEIKNFPQKKPSRKPITRTGMRKKVPIKKAPALEQESTDAIEKSDANEAPKSSYTLNFNKLDDSVNPFVSCNKLPDSPKQTEPCASAYSFNPDDFDTTVDACKSSEMRNIPTLDVESDCHADDSKLAAEAQASKSPQKKKKSLNSYGLSLIAGFDQPIQLDYLEQFGSTSMFQESALRKQSLYLKFDPLLHESPQKKNAHIFEVSHELMDFLDKNANFPGKTPDWCCFGQTERTRIGTAIRSGQSAAPQVAGAIMDVCCYTQAEMETNLHHIHAEVCKLFHLFCGNELINAESFTEKSKTYMPFCGLIVEEGQREKAATEQRMQTLVSEREQAFADVVSLEKSLADLFRRNEKLREAVEGYRKNEETLKKCTQEVLARVKKEEQRYQALKAHAEEKLDKANEEMAAIRARTRAETVALQASQRMDQVKIQSLEMRLEEKVRF